MLFRSKARLGLQASAVLLLAAAGRAQSLASSAPTVDRYMYVFAAEPGERTTIPIFGATATDSATAPGLPPPTDSRFDDRDAQYLITFDTSGAFTPGAPPESYTVSLVRLTVQVADDSDLAFRYDPTYDSWREHLFQGDEFNPPDSGALPKDPGSPIELYAVAYRNGFTPFTYTNFSPFKPGGQAAPWINVRNAYCVGFSDEGAQLDASNTLKQLVDVPPLGTGQIAGGSPGAFVPARSLVSLTVDLARAGNLAYVRSGLAAGRLSLLVTTVNPATEMGIGGVKYPIIHASRAAGEGVAGPRLEIVGAPACTLDYNVDTVVNPDDLGDFITDYFTDPAIPGPGGYAVACSGNPPPYDAGYRAAFVADGGGQCNEPFPDNLGDFITAYFAGGC